MMNPYSNDRVGGHGFSRSKANQNIADLARKVLDSNVPTTTNSMRKLGSAFRGPGPHDVICARGKQALNHPGNLRFREMIAQSLDEYSEASTKLEKSNIVSTIVDAVREASPHGGFVKEVDGTWYEVG